MQLSEQEIVRRESLKKLRDLGINPYPAAQFETTSTVGQVVEEFEALEGKEVVLAGRIMSRRIMGKASFAELKDSTGRMQIYINRDELCPGCRVTVPPQKYADVITGRSIETCSHCQRILYYRPAVAPDGGAEG